jgi:hypothetical protein
MTRIKKLTPEEEITRDGLEYRVLQLYREKRALIMSQQRLEERIDHLESQIAKVGGPGMDISRILSNTKDLDLGKNE